MLVSVTIEVEVMNGKPGSKARVMIPMPSDLYARSKDPRLMIKIAQEVLRAFSMAYLKAVEGWK